MGSRVDWALTRWSRKVRTHRSPIKLGGLQKTSCGEIRVYDHNPTSINPCVIFVPDGPNVIEHYHALIAALSPSMRAVCFDMPGFGHSLPQLTTTHGLDAGAHVVFAVMDALGIARATLAFSCANGFYAIRAAQIAPARISRLMLAQTPSLSAMHAWVRRIIPWPVRVPVLGQFVAWVLRRRIGVKWYLVGLPRLTDPQPFQALTRNAFAQGGCFCLAGVVQGLMAEPRLPAGNVTTPCTMIWGGADRSHTSTQPQSLLAHLPNAEIVHWPDCGHFPELEQPARYAQLLLRAIGSERV